MSLITTQKPETFLLSQEQQDKLPPASREALEQVDQRMLILPSANAKSIVKYFLATAPSNWQPDQIIRRYQLPTGEYVSCVLWYTRFSLSSTDMQG
jgi:transcription factor STE12